jgi:hypothetical protein
MQNKDHIIDGGNRIKIRDSDDLINYASFLFLRGFLSKEFEGTRLDFFLRGIKETCETYHETFPYGDLYILFLRAIAEVIEQPFKDDIKEKIQIDEFVKIIYRNPSEALKLTGDFIHSSIVKPITNKSNLSRNIEHIIASHLNHQSHKKINQVTPQDARSTPERLNSIIGSNVKPQFSTNIPYVRKYEYNANKPPTDICMGMRTQMHHNHARVDPTFPRWLETLPEDPMRVQHIYFNSLRRNKKWPLDLEGKREQSMTEVLHDLEERFKGRNNIAVITLPSNDGAISLDRRNKKNLTLSDWQKQILAIALEDPNAPKIEDFHISKKIREKIFKTVGMVDSDAKKKEKEELEKLIKNSCVKLGYNDPHAIINLAQQQAIYFDFIKYELTNFIIEQLDPSSINFTCKDGIDRGGIASAYYHLISSIESGKAMSEEEFTCALHAAPALVKGRGMNNNIERLWNAISAYIDAQEGKKNIPPWLYTWRDNYAPKNSKYDFIKRLDNYIKIRTKEESEKKSATNSFFGKYRASDKIRIATTLRLNLKKYQRLDQNIFLPDELKLLSDGRLKAIFSDLKKFGYVADEPQQHKHQWKHVSVHEIPRNPVRISWQRHQDQHEDKDQQPGTPRF